MLVYTSHAFLKIDINKVANNYTCGDCTARFIRASDLTRHAPRCTRGRTNIECPGSRILAPESAFEKAFYPEGGFGIKATCWLEYVSRQSGTHIHHHRCGHWGERIVAGCKVDGYHPATKTVFQFHGCHWHGCIKCFPNPEQRTEVIRVDKNGKETTRDWSKDGNTRGRDPGGTTNFHRKETKRTHTRSSLTSKLIKTRQRQATRHVIFLMKVSMCLSQSLSLTR